MKSKIEIKHCIIDSILFEFECDGNSLIKTVMEAVKGERDLQGSNLQGAYLQGANLRGANLQGSNLQGAYLQGANLQGANLRGADLQGADLQGANLRGAYLQGAYLQGANLRGANLRGSDLQGADLQGADLQGAEKIQKAIVFTGLYTYVVIPYITEKEEKRIKMGCHDRLLSEWESDFWNNPNEFPNDGSESSQLRMMAYNTAKAWFEIVLPSKNETT